MFENRLQYSVIFIRALRKYWIIIGLPARRSVYLDSMIITYRSYSNTKRFNNQIPVLAHRYVDGNDGNENLLMSDTWLTKWYILNSCEVHVCPKFYALQIVQIVNTITLQYQNPFNYETKGLLLNQENWSA